MTDGDRRPAVTSQACGDPTCSMQYAPRPHGHEQDAALVMTVCDILWDHGIYAEDTAPAARVIVDALRAALSAPDPAPSEGAGGLGGERLAAIDEDASRRFWDALRDDASEYGRLLAERDRLVADGVDPADLDMPLEPTP